MTTLDWMFVAGLILSIPLGFALYSTANYLSLWNVFRYRRSKQTWLETIKDIFST